VDAVHIERFNPDRHDRSNFGCGDASLDRWLREDAPAAGRTSGVRVAVATVDDQLVGCYRLSSFQIEAGQPIEGFGSTRPPVPAILLSRLGIETHWQHRGLGTSLMLQAMGLAADAALALDAALLVAHAEGEAAKAFCTRFGFQPFRSQPGWFYLRLRDVEATLSSADPRPRAASR
jgi:ribosomal protein S18 acetylase RimI-like enzyme